MLYNIEPLANLANVIPPPYIINGLIRKNTITLLSSEPHCGKTMLMLYFNLCMEQGIKVFDTYEVPYRTSAIFIGVDSPRWDLALQYQKLAKGLGITSMDMAMMDSMLLGRGVRPKPDIMDVSFPDWLEEVTETYHTNVIFIDTLRRVHHLNENDSGEMSEVMERLEGFVDKGKATIIMATHTSKPSQAERSSLYSIRGSTVIPGSADFHYSLRQGKEGRILFDGSSKRRGENRDKGFMVLEFLENEHGLRIHVHDTPSPETLTKKILEQLAIGPSSAKVLTPICGGSYSGVQKALKHLLDVGKVTRKERGIWSLSTSSL